MTERVVACDEPIPGEVEEGEVYYWCTCGLSQGQPFCDGSHAGTELRPLAWVADRTGTVQFCCCKQTKTEPLCDGSHATLEAD